MNTSETLDGRGEHILQDGAAPAGTRLPFSALPVFGPRSGVSAQAAKAAGIALAYAHEASEACDEDCFMLALVDSDGAVFSRLGPFREDDVVAIWRDMAVKAGLARMIVREDGVISPVSQQIGRLALGRTRMRRRHGSLCERRPRFLVRRKTGRLPARPLIHRGEQEIIARS